MAGLVRLALGYAAALAYVGLVIGAVLPIITATVRVLIGRF